MLFNYLQQQDRCQMDKRTSHLWDHQEPKSQPKWQQINIVYTYILLIFIPGLCPYMLKSQMNLNCLYYKAHLYTNCSYYRTHFVTELLCCILCTSNNCNCVLQGHANAPINMSTKQHTPQLKPRTLEHIVCLIYVSHFTNKQHIKIILYLFLTLYIL